MRLYAVLVLSLLGIMPLGALHTMAAEKAEDSTKEDIVLNDAKWQCVQFIMQKLDYPGLAKFEFFGTFPGKAEADGSYSADATYRENELSPQKKSRCLMNKNSRGEWQLKSIAPLP